MIVIAGLFLGAIIGVLVAKRRKGNGLDMLQYGAIYAIIFALLALFGTIIFDRIAG